MLQKQLLLGGLKLQVIRKRKGLWLGKRVSKGLVFLLISLLGLSGVGGFLGLLNAQTRDATVTLTVEPLLDRYGVPSVNEDGSFYPCDRFKIVYSVELVGGDSSGDGGFDEVTIRYDSSIFNMFSNSSGFGVERVGGGGFEVLSYADAGTYFFSVEVWGSRSTGNNGVERYVVAEATLNVEVVKYDPHFVLNLAYTIPMVNNSNSISGGGSSFEKPFVLLLRYEGNGPDFNLRQRAVVDEYFWEGYAQKIPELDQMQQTLTPKLTVSDFFNQNSNIQFIAQGIDEAVRVSQPLVSVDEKSFQSSELPKTFFWEKNSNHTYTWTQTLLKTDAPSEGMAGSYDEWFEWQLCIVFPPTLNSSGQMDLLSQTDPALLREVMQNQLLEQFNSRSGTLTVNQFGNTLTALYAHNKLLEKFATEAGVTKNQTLQ